MCGVFFLYKKNPVQKRIQESFSSNPSINKHLEINKLRIKDTSSVIKSIQLFQITLQLIFYAFSFFGEPTESWVQTHEVIALQNLLDQDNLLKS